MDYNMFLETLKYNHLFNPSCCETENRVRRGGFILEKIFSYFSREKKIEEYKRIRIRHKINGYDSVTTQRFTAEEFDKLMSTGPKTLENRANNN
ncbi:hypothetical protein GF336_06350 [Candidatus Woesearchaeota archaeon]|nr:hypothetical protein [Candidatus Woesearchaeota archaeon]